tara:strand:+ start:519 stop:734 length:216 start_codon:yes stop_codon:yes gene_type:complete
MEKAIVNLKIVRTLVAYLKTYIMKRIYTQSEPTALSTGIAVKFRFKDSKSLVQVTSDKVKKNSDFDKPIKY